ncbi:hypothetical protein KUV57_12745 [Epibacterium sp. DP7N7-1]|nr:hypothetical protein [Epibacterium sp. DP7N7-1]
MIFLFRRRRVLAELILPTLLSSVVGACMIIKFQDEQKKFNRFKSHCEESGGQVFGRVCMVMRAPILPALSASPMNVLEIENYLGSLN